MADSTQATNRRKAKKSGSLFLNKVTALINHLTQHSDNEQNETDISPEASSNKDSQRKTNIRTTALELSEVKTVLYTVEPQWLERFWDHGDMGS